MTDNDGKCECGEKLIPLPKNDSEFCGNQKCRYYAPIIHNKYLQSTIISALQERNKELEKLGKCHFKYAKRAVTKWPEWKKELAGMSNKDLERKMSIIDTCSTTSKQDVRINELEKDRERLIGALHDLVTELPIDTPDK